MIISNKVDTRCYKNIAPFGRINGGPLLSYSREHSYSIFREHRFSLIAIWNYWEKYFFKNFVKKKSLGKISPCIIQDAILTIGTAMSTIVPPAHLQNSASAPAFEFVMSRCPAPDFDYPEVFWDHVEVSYCEFWVVGILEVFWDHA